MCIKSLKRNLILILSVVYISCMEGNAIASDVMGQSCKSVTNETCSIAHNLGRGVNMGNMLDAPREGDWGVRLDPIYIDKVTTAFNTVRLPIRWSNHAAPTEDATLDEFFAARVDKIVDGLLAKGVNVILNVHHYNQIYGDKLSPNEFEVPSNIVEARFINIWTQLAKRYEGRSPKLIFELLNEPHGLLNAESWNVLLSKTLGVVRLNNPNRVVMVGPVEWNNIKSLEKLKLPIDRNLIISVHNYDPYPFTFQGITYLPKVFPVGEKCCDTSQRKLISDGFDLALKWNASKGYPLHLGEFGSYKTGDLVSREIYTRFVRDEVERRGLGWTYWEFASSFGVFDPKTSTWVEPIRRALLD